MVGRPDVEGIEARRSSDIYHMAETIEPSDNERGNLPQCTAAYLNDLEASSVYLEQAHQDIPALIAHIKALEAVVKAAREWAKDDRPIKTDAEEQLYADLAALGDGDG